MSDFSFDYWSKLFKASPEDFEAKRKEFLEAEICKAPVEARNKLRILQMQCDAARTGVSPIEATLELSTMMKTHMTKLQDELVNLRAACNRYLEEYANIKDKKL
jgi:hypothetical protein